MVEYLDKEFGGKAEKRRREYSCRGEELRFVSLMLRKKEHDVQLTFSRIIKVLSVYVAPVLTIRVTELNLQ
jgi:hypothetical protein